MSIGLLQGIFKRIANVLQRIIDGGHVFEGTLAWEGTQTALQLARRVTNEGVVYSRQPCVVVKGDMDPGTS